MRKLSGARKLFALALTLVSLMSRNTVADPFFSLSPKQTEGNVLLDPFIVIRERQLSVRGFGRNPRICR